MRFSLFGRGEGVRVSCAQSLWASTTREVVTDASVSARKRGVRVGMNRATVQALVPDVALVREEEQLQSPTALVMESIWPILWRFSPWLETRPPDAFWLQVSGQAPPLREVRSLLQRVDALLTDEQRLRVGFAATPFLAQALVEWSFWEKVPGALYRKAGRQQLLLSPDTVMSVAQGVSARNPSSGVAAGTPGQWLADMPVVALWLIPERTREALVQLGMRRLRDLQRAGPERLSRHFGKDAFVWLSWLQPQLQTRQSVRVNYPPPRWQEAWRAEVGEAVSRDQLWAVVKPLAASLSLRLQRAELGALTVGLTWRTDAGEGGFERAAKRPLWREDAVLAQLRSGLERALKPTADAKLRTAADAKLAGQLEAVCVYVEGLRSLSGTQLTFEVRNGAFEAARPAGENVEQLVRQVNHRYPNGLRIGVRPGFRELRLQAVLGI
ncbi:Y-family DNA polymerase [Alicyclobacillus sp. ALC3]|uniref:Y-family DNA polymerase n=1 Tax=Alicyclobacillus sp. ALC3 TaxID=2796143 RepID=UPI0023780EC3|nr:hypothetical protein [Alicyclobacillus sp. ALC3]WDL98031.1 hypothetical protein JC200_04815 [Alicyclobacillus sp. ALC3]